MLPKKPDFEKIEKKWQVFWEREKIFRFEPKSRKPIYSIDTPPPTVSGRAHMGHALNYTLFDIVARYKRLMGFNVFMPIGFDDNGQPTERFVEKKLGINSKEMKRAEFNAIVRKEIKEAEKQLKEDLITFGFSCDWELLYRTIDKPAIKAAQTSFLDLYRKGLIYRKKEPVIWCPSCQTALSQADVEDKHRKTTLNYLYFELEGGGKIEIATTRPELLPACVGVFVHPKDKRYKKIIGKRAIVPLFGYLVPIMADEKVDPDFGSGVVMICTFGDATDIEWWKKHKLPLKIVLTEGGKLNDLAGKYAGLDLKTAREAILDDLAGMGYLIRQEPLEQTVGVCWRCATPIEFLVAEQWFIRIMGHKRELLKRGRQVKWFPPYFRKRYEDWIKNLSWDWIISRQRHFGVPIPVWYCANCGEVILPTQKDLPVDPLKQKPKRACKCGSRKFIGEKDVFDTWMTSSLTPELALGWPDKPLPKKLFPMDLRPSGHDIIRSWEFYTILKAHYHFNKLPWKNVLINGMAQDPQGKAMHKSKGNVISPQDMIKKYNTDALRYWTVCTSVGEDIPFREQELVRGVKLQIKLWNSARFCESHLKKIKKPKLHIIDKWILSLLNRALKNYIKFMDAYQLEKARREIEFFFYSRFCDFYIEMVKHRLYGSDVESKNAAAWTLYTALLTILKMWAPIMPHITEEIYQQIFRKFEEDKSIHVSSLAFEFRADRKAEELGELACEAISAIRKWKQEKGLGVGAEVERLTLFHPKAKELEKVADVVAGTMRVKELEILKRELKACQVD